jgi:hypothetical protein
MYFVNFGLNFVVIFGMTPVTFADGKSQFNMKLKKFLFTAAILILTSANYGFKNANADRDWMAYTNSCLSESFDQSADPKLKKAEITLTPDYFVRLRKYYARNRQVYYSFNLQQFSDMDYLGNTSNGVLQLKTLADDIIVQTYNDRHGDIDSMATTLDIPVKNMGPERLDSLHEAFNYFKARGL